MIRYIIFFSIVSFLLTSLSYFSFKNFFFEYNRYYFVIICFLLSLLILSLYIYQNNLENRILSRLFSFIIFLYLGIVTFGFAFHLSFEFLTYFINQFSENFNFFGKEISREEFIKILNSYIYKTLFFLFVLWGIFETIKTPKIKSVKIKIKNLSDNLNGFKIAQISDLHVGPTIQKEFVEKVVNRVNSLKADLVAITGDLVDGSILKFASHVEPLKNLESIHGTFYVTGNHEYYSGVIEWLKKFESLGFNILLNENSILNINNSKLLVAGVTDLKAGNIYYKHKTDPAKAVKTNEIVDLKILLAHQPNSILESHKYGFDLQLSGHTHGGQYFPGNFLIHLFQRYVSGLYKHEDTYLYVSKGTGYWGPPFRLGASPEITLLTLVKD